MPLYDLIKSILDDLYTNLIEARDLEELLGLNPHEINEPSEKCRLVLERGLTKDVCTNFREIRRWVACRTWQLLDEGKYTSWRDAIRQAWREAKEGCFKIGVVV